MGFVEAALGFPAVVFTVLLVPVVLFWLTAVLGALDVDIFGDIGGEGAGGVDADADVDLDADGGGSDGVLGGWWQALGLAGVPVTVAASLVVVFGWLVALVATAALDGAGAGGGVRLALAPVVVVVAFVVGSLAASVAARPLARLFVTTHAETRAAFVGRTCIVRTTRVTADFGQAEAADPAGGTVLVPVRVAEGTRTDAGGDLGMGSPALIYEYDVAGEVFLVCPVDDALGAGADGPS